MTLEKIQNLKNSESQKFRILRIKKTQKDFSEFLFSEVLNF